MINIQGNNNRNNQEVKPNKPLFPFKIQNNKVSN